MHKLIKITIRLRATKLLESLKGIVTLEESQRYDVALKIVRHAIAMTDKLKTATISRDKMELV